MNQQNNSSAPTSPKQIFFARLQLLALMAVFAAPLVAAYYFYSIRDTFDFQTVNNGELYRKPQDLIDLPISIDGGESVKFNSLEKKWYLLVVADGACNEICEKNLLTIRQLRRMQGKNINRIASVLVHRNLENSLAVDLAAKYSIKQARVQGAAQFDEWLAPFYQARGDAQFDASRIYLVDPLKKLMMSYPSDVEPKSFYKDLKRLLKVSQVG